MDEFIICSSPLVTATALDDPAVPGGVLQVIVVGPVLVASVQVAPPIVTPRLVPAKKFVPVMVTGVKPAGVPVLGEMEVMLGAKL